MSSTRRRAISPSNPESGIQVRPFAVGFTKNYAFAKSRSEWHGLIYASAGVMSVHTASGSWVVPPHRAVWVPAGMERRIEVSAGLAMRTLYFKPGLAKSLPRDCCVVNVPPLMRELILHTIDIGMLNRTIPSHARLIGVLIDQLRALSTVPLQLPQPTDPRAVKVAAMLEAKPGAKLPLGKIARQAGASARTIERLFRAETKMTFASWRERLRLLHALRLLAAGEAVTNVALELGYASASAFIAMFRRAVGTTPSRYYRALIPDEAPSSDRPTPHASPERGTRGRPRPEESRPRPRTPQDRRP
jgi:AraC-like DNA-binding protein